jgi:hypothetical protein
VVHRKVFIWRYNFKIKSFVRTSAYAVKVPVWTALIAILILRYLQLKAKFTWLLSKLVALLRMNLFTYRILWAWPDQPFGTPAHSPPAQQQEVLTFQ